MPCKRFWITGSRMNKDMFPFELARAEAAAIVKPTIPLPEYRPMIAIDMFDGQSRTEPTHLTGRTVRQIFDYDNGHLYWRHGSPRSGKCRAGNLAGSPTDKEKHHGYTLISTERFKNVGRCQRAHRVIWLWVHRRWPKKGMVIDHINGDPADNRIENLREVTRSENSKNNPATRGER